MSLLGGIELAPLITKIKVDIKGFKNELEQVKTEAVAKTKEVSKQMEKTIKVGENMSKLGGTMTKTLTLPIAGAGVAATKMAMDYETSFAKVSTLLDSNVVDYNKYKDDLLEASDDSKVAVDEFSEAVYGSISAGVDQTKAIKFTTDAMKLAKGGFTDGAKAVDVMTTAINGYSLSAEDATEISDMLITTQNLGKTTVDELASSMGAVIPVASSVNFGMDELSASYAQLTKNGISTAESGTYLKSMLSELGKSGSITDGVLRELTGKGFADLKKEGTSTSEILSLLSDYAEENGKTLKDMFGSVEAGSAALVLAKGDGEEYNEMLDAMKSSAGATQEAFEKMDATPAEKLKGSLNELKNSGIKLGEKLIPVVTKIADTISDLVDWFNELSPAQQENIVKMGGMVAIAGPLLKITGGLVQGYGKLKPLISGVTTMFSKGAPVVGKFATSLLKSGTSASGLTGLLPSLTAGIGNVGLKMMECSVGPIAKIGTAMAGAATSSGGLLASLGTLASGALPVIGVVGGVAAAGYGLYKCLSQEVIPSVDLFADSTTAAYNAVTGQVEYSTVKISEETQKQVQSYIDLSTQAQQESMNMYAGITAVTDENVASITSKVETMAGQIITATNTQRDEVVKGYQDMFANTTVLTDQEQQEIMQTVNTGYDERVRKTNDLKAELTKIYQEIADSGGSITKNQQERIDALYDQMKEQAVQAMAENEAEQNVILNRLSGSNKEITAEMVGESIQQMNKLKDESIQKAAEKRDALVLEAEKLKTLEGGKYKEKAEMIIEAANKEYEESVEAADKLRSEGIDKLMSAHTELADSIDTETGEIVSYWDKLFGKWNRWQPEKKVAVVETKYTEAYTGGGGRQLGFDGSHYNGLDYVPFDGYNARLHEGERVLTKKENEEYTEPKTKGKDITITIPFSLDAREFAIATAGFTAEELGF